MSEPDWHNNPWDHMPETQVDALENQIEVLRGKLVAREAEIDRLRAALRDVLNDLDQYDATKILAWTSVIRARAALEGK